VAIDVGFREEGEPVRAAARGMVTYSDIEGWDTERGVVIIAHIFPDGSRYFTVYGHLEQTDEYSLPQAGLCVEKGEVIGAIGVPTRSLPHLHYEVRDFLPDDGGPGYISGDPLLAGWYHPLDFTRLWQVRLTDAYIDHVTLPLAPSLPPVTLDNGHIALASGQTVTVTTSRGEVRWRVNMDDIISGIDALPDNRVIARSRSGQTVVLGGGRYQALWNVEGPDVPFIRLDDALIFVTDGGGLAAYDFAGQPLWTLVPRVDEDARVIAFERGAAAVGLAVEVEDGVLWRVVDGFGMPLYEATYASRPVIAPNGDGWTLLADDRLIALDGEPGRPVQNHVVGQVDWQPRVSAQMVSDRAGNTYVYLADFNRTLLSLDADGQERWRVRYPEPVQSLLSPLLAVDEGCLLFGLDADGVLTVFDAADGSIVTELELYPGGSRTGRPGSRLLSVSDSGELTFSGGFLSLVRVDTRALAADVLDRCQLG
ncbi:MAG: PQQ-binding-like beta-propeller repeat protein, partial [Phototrophicaceae bacterium]